MIYIDSNGRAQDINIDRKVNAIGPRRISKLIRESNGLLLEPKKGYAVNPAFAELSPDGKRVIIKHEDTIKLIGKNMAVTKPRYRFFEEETFPISSTLKKDFEGEYKEWKKRYGGLLA